MSIKDMEKRISFLENDSVYHINTWADLMRWVANRERYPDRYYPPVILSPEMEEWIMEMSEESSIMERESR